MTGQTTITCVNESNNESVTCNSCTDFDIGSSKGLLVSDGTNDIFFHAPVKVEFGTVRVTFYSVHDEGSKTGRFLYSALQSPNNTESAISSLVESCGSGGAGSSTDNQNIEGLQLNGTDLIVGIEDGQPDTVSLSGLSGTDNQQISTNNAPGNVSLEDGGSVTINVEDGDASNANEKITGLSLDGVNLEVIEGADTLTVGLGSLQDGTGTDDQVISTNGSSGSITIEDGNTIILNVDDADSDPANEYITAFNFVSPNLTVTDGGSAWTLDISDITNGVNTDNQQLSPLGWDASNQQLTVALEDGGSVSISLASLEDELQLSGDDLSIIGSSGATIDLSPYLDDTDTDEQEISQLSYNAGVLTVGLERGNVLTVDISEPESDPIFLAHPSNGITQTQIDAWDADNDGDDTNELDPIVISQDAADRLTFGGDGTSGGPIDIEFVIDSTLTALVLGSGGSDDQILSFNASTNILTLEDGGTVDLTILDGANVTRATITGLTTSSFTSPITLTSTEAERQILINGTGAEETATREHPNHITISGQTITGYENFEADDIIVITVYK